MVTAQLPAAVNFFAVHFQYDILGANAGFFRRVAGENLGHQDACVPLDAVIAFQLLCEILNADAQPAPGDFTLALQLRDDAFGHVDGNGKADPLAPGDNGGIDADNLSFHVNEGTAAVARVDGGIGSGENHHRGPDPMTRPLALMMPTVTVCSRPKGFPMANDPFPQF